MQDRSGRQEDTHCGAVWGGKGKRSGSGLKQQEENLFHGHWAGSAVIREECVILADKLFFCPGQEQ